MKKKPSGNYEASFMIGGDFTKDGLRMLEKMHVDFDGRSEIFYKSKMKESINKEKPFGLSIVADSEEALEPAWSKLVNRVSVINGLEKSAKFNPIIKWCSWSEISNLGWAKRSLLVTWSKQIDPFFSTPSIPRMTGHVTCEAIHGMTIGTFASKAGPGIRLGNP